MQTIGNSLSQATQNLLESAATLLPGLFAAAFALAVFLALARLAWGGVIAADRFVGTPRLARLAGGVAYYLLLGAGAMVALDVLGVSPQSIATAFGLGGVALGFALRDIVSNLVAGVLLIASQEFAVGDQIVVGETEGTVEQVELRATHIRTYDGRMVIVPNAIIYNSRVINNTESPFRRGSVFLHLGYGVDLTLVQRIVLDAVITVHGVAASPPPTMRVNDLAAGSILLEARFWTDSKRLDFMNTASAVREAIVGTLKRHAVPLPDASIRVVRHAARPASDGSAPDSAAF
jgi:small conductance mechanosensitive channel